MGKFETPLQVELMEGEKTWKLVSDFVYNDEKFGLIAVPEGFETDFASVPRIPIIFDLVGSMGQAAATLHDYLYTYGKISRADCDHIFWEALRTTGIGPVRARIMWLGVRLFGWLFFMKKAVIDAQV